MPAWHRIARGGRRKPALADVLEEHTARVELLVSMLERQQAVNLEVAARLEGLTAADARHLERLEALERGLDATAERLDGVTERHEAEDARLWRVLHSRTDHLA
jgi:hypothetical protein